MNVDYSRPSVRLVREDRGCVVVVGSFLVRPLSFGDASSTTKLINAPGPVSPLLNYGQTFGYQENEGFHVYLFLHWESCWPLNIISFVCDSAVTSLNCVYLGPRYINSIGHSKLDALGTTICLIFGQISVLPHSSPVLLGLFFNLS